MTKWLLIGLLPLFVCAESLKIEHLRTELYSKAAENTLKKIELSLEFEGENLRANENRLLDSTNTVIASFFYEDIFTELGKMRFKEALSKFASSHYGISVKNVFILSLKGIESFDLDELKSFLEDSETPANTRKRQLKKAFKESNSSAKATPAPKNAPLQNFGAKQSVQIPPLPNVSALLDDNAAGGALNALLSGASGANALSDEALNALPAAALKALTKGGALNGVLPDNAALINKALSNKALPASNALNALSASDAAFDLSVDDINPKILPLPDIELVKDIPPQPIKLKDGNFTGVKKINLKRQSHSIK